jgi:hypothetical protein
MSASTNLLPGPVPNDSDYASVIAGRARRRSAHRLDSRQPALALMSTIAYPISDY